MHRRDALKFLAAAAGLPALARAAAPLAASAAPGAAPSSIPAGIQLYTLRDAMAKDADGTLAALSKIGYREVEMAGLYGHSAADFRHMLDAHGLTAPSSHIPLVRLRDDWAGVQAEATTLGHKFIVCPYVDAPMRTADGFHQVVTVLNAAGRQAHDAGYQLAYHNHDFEFATVDGITGAPYDFILASTDPALVKMEMDLFWTTKAKQDPVAIFRKHPGRFPLVHVKDMGRDGKFADVGTGTINFKRIFARRAEAGIQHYFVEHDQPADALATARVSYRGLRRLLDPFGRRRSA